MRLVLLVIGFLFWHSVAHGQDPNFSQFFVSPLSLNPAMTGKFNGTLRVSGNYRDQWPTIARAFITSTLSLDLPLLRNKINPLDTWGVGLMAMTDQTANGILSTNMFSLTTAYHKSIDENGRHQIGLGFQGTFNTRRLDGTRLNFEDELDQLGGWSIPSMEAVNNQSLSLDFTDLSAGILYNGATHTNNHFYLGFSAYHLNQPKASFTGDVFYTLNPRYTLNAGGAIPLKDISRTIYVSTLYSAQAGAHNFTGGLATGFSLNNDPDDPTIFYSGLWARINSFTESLIPYLGLEFKGVRVGLSYDVNVSRLKTASQSRGGLELSLVYIKRPPGYKPMPCPKF